jgi:hypothetical protein
VTDDIATINPDELIDGASVAASKSKPGPGRPSATVRAQRLVAGPLVTAVTELVDGGALSRLCEWKRTANYGAVYVYYTGWLTKDEVTLLQAAGPPAQRRTSEQLELTRLGEELRAIRHMAWAGWLEGTFYLLQRRLDVNRFAYLIIRRRVCDI